MNKKGIRNAAIQSLLAIVGGKMGGEVKGQVCHQKAEEPVVQRLFGWKEGAGWRRKQVCVRVCLCLRGKKRRRMEISQVSCCSRCGWLAGPSLSGLPLGSAHWRRRLPEARSWVASSLLEQTHTQRKSKC